MDKSCIMDDKKVKITSTPRLHRLIARMPEAAREYGLWIINGSIGAASGPITMEKMEDRRFEFYSLSHMFSGHGRLRIGSRTWEVSPGDAVLICPGQWHLYGGCDGFDYCEDAICFCGRVPDFMVKSGLLTSGVVHLGSVRRLVPVIETARSLSPNAWLKSALELQQLLLEVSAGRNSSPMESLLETIHTSPPEHWWSVVELAELRGISCDRLRREFLRHTGMLPKNYLEHFKLRRAAEYMVTFSASVTDTAMRFGYMDRYHFSRRFKHLFGISPDQYRKLFSGKISDDTLRH